MMTREEAQKFSASWLPAWTGNDAEKLVAFYTDDVFYSDPSVPEGVEGRPALLRYLTWLLGNNPAWVWTQRDAVPMEGGFLNKWKLEAPVGDRVVTCNGVCTVEFRGPLIRRNEVYFDTLPLMNAIADWNRRKHAKSA